MYCTADAESDQSLLWPPNKIIGYYRMYEWRATAWMILCTCAGWSKSTHFAHVWRTFLLDVAKMILSNTHLYVDTGHRTYLQCHSKVYQSLQSASLEVSYRSHSWSKAQNISTVSFKGILDVSYRSHSWSKAQNISTVSFNQPVSKCLADHIPEVLTLKAIDTISEMETASKLFFPPSGANSYLLEQIPFQEKTGMQENKQEVTKVVSFV